MPNAIPPIPIKSPLVDKNGNITPAWAGFLVELYRRVGGTFAPTNIDLDSGDSTLGSTVETNTTDIAVLLFKVSGLLQGRQL